eukprot:314025-Hanusia_phi.AAC.1
MPLVGHSTLVQDNAGGALQAQTPLSETEHIGTRVLPLDVQGELPSAEWAVLPPCKRVAAIPEEATAKANLGEEEIDRERLAGSSTARRVQEEHSRCTRGYPLKNRIVCGLLVFD